VKPVDKSADVRVTLECFSLELIVRRQVLLQLSEQEIWSSLCFKIVVLDAVFFQTGL